MRKDKQQQLPYQGSMQIHFRACMLVSVPPLWVNYDDRILLGEGTEKRFLGSNDIGFNFKKGSIYFFLCFKQDQHYGFSLPLSINPYLNFRSPLIYTIRKKQDLIN